MRRVYFRLAKTAFAAIISLLALAIIVPPFLDRVYYTGPVSDHFDGEHFFNPGDNDGNAPGSASGRASRMIGFMLGRGRAVWPAHISVRQDDPPARVSGSVMRAVWVGHSTVLVQTAGLNILTDPIWSERTGPFGLGPKRHRDPGIRFENLPKIDLVLLSHNHYDHLDIPTLRRLWLRDRPLVVTSLGNDTLLKANGIGAAARDWGGSVAVRPGITVFIDRVHHWDSRWFRDRNRALWSGFTVVLPGGNLFFSGDTGLGDGRWPDLAARHGRIRFALIAIGAFKPREIMEPSHINPAQAVEVYEKLGAFYAMAVHWGTFQLSAEAINEPPMLLRQSLSRELIPPGRFRVTEAGQPWLVPPIADFQRVSGNFP